MAKKNTEKKQETTQDDTQKTIISWSGGKDSTATVILAHEMGIKIDEIIFSEVMYDRIRGISGELPEHIDFMKNVAIPKFEEWGFKTTILHADKDFIDLFYKRIEKPKNKSHLGKIAGYLLANACYANTSLKVGPMLKYEKSLGTVNKLIGIAIDEPKRLARLAPPE